MLNGVVDETMISGYVVLPVDDCGHIPIGSTPLGFTAKNQVSAPTCCDNTVYSINITLTNPTYKKIMVVPAGSNPSIDYLDDGVVIDLVDNTASLNDGSASGTTAMQLAPAAMALGLTALIF